MIVYCEYGLGQKEEAIRVFRDYEELEHRTGIKDKDSREFREWVYSAFPELLQECIAKGVYGPSTQ